MTVEPLSRLAESDVVRLNVGKAESPQLNVKLGEAFCTAQ